MAAKGPDDLLRFIVWYIETHGFSPSVREMQAAMGVRSTHTISMWLERLRDAGKLDWVPNQPRTVHLLGD